MKLWGRSDSNWDAPAAFRISLLLQASIALFALALLVGCAGGRSTTGAETASVAPSIVIQPDDQTVPMGLAGSFSVTVNGYPMTFQWSKDGVPIPGATDSNYTTPATAFTDSGSMFSVTLSNSLGSLTSVPAALTVTARAPMADDLRFQQVDAASTVDGYDSGGGFSSDVWGGVGTYSSGSIGFPLVFSAASCTVPVPTQYPAHACLWIYDEFPLVGSSLSIGYGADFLTNFQADLASSSFPAGGSALDSANSVVTSLDMETADNLFAASWIQTSQPGGFSMSQQTVAPADFQAAAAQEGAGSRVITAVAYNAGQVVYLSYGWQGDPSTIYETQVSKTSFEAAPTVAASLAAQGYILTAMGGSYLDDALLLVGTRVQGDTMPRPFAMVSSVSGEVLYTTLMQPGYAIVGALQDAHGNFTFLGER